MIFFKLLFTVLALAGGSHFGSGGGSGGSMPAGAVVSYAGTSAPDGWLMCDGSAVSRATYATLFAAIGTAHGSGDGSTTFNLPDYRGRFLRGVDGAAGNDPDKASRTAMATGGNTGNNVGSVQADELKSHTHETNVLQDTTGGTQYSAVFNSGDANGAEFITDATGGNETRPKNAYVHFIIKY